MVKPSIIVSRRRINSYVVNKCVKEENKWLGYVVDIFVKE
jgi:hypothetical protein